MKNLWKSQNKFPAAEEMKEIEGIQHINVHTAITGEYQFLLGAAIIKYQDVLYASWANSYRGENDDNTILAMKKSCDNGTTWQEYGKISRQDPGYGRSHGVFWEYRNKLYAFCPKARYDRIDAYPDLKMEAYVLNEQGEWECLGIVLEQDFWPMCEPVCLDNGSFLMAGLKTDDAQAAVALSVGDITKWEMKILPNPHNFTYWGETTVLKQTGKLTAIVRGGGDLNCALVSESFDNGQTWSGLEQTNLPISQSKMYTGTLADGRNYLVFNAPGNRDTLCIALGHESFEKVYRIRHGFEAPPRFWVGNEWCYPYAFEDRQNNTLYVIYAKNKEDCELAIIPLESLK